MDVGYENILQNIWLTTKGLTRRMLTGVGGENILQNIWPNIAREQKTTGRTHPHRRHAGRNARAWEEEGGSGGRRQERREGSNLLA